MFYALKDNNNTLKIKILISKTIHTDVFLLYSAIIDRKISWKYAFGAQIGA